MPVGLLEQARWLVTRDQALRAGLSSNAIASKVVHTRWPRFTEASAWYKSPLIHVAIPANRRVRPPRGVAIHISSGGSAGWRFARGMPPHTFADETVIDLANAATGLDDVIAYVTGAFARNLTSEERLRREAAARSRLRWRADLDEIIPRAADGAHSVLEYRYDRDVEQAHGLPTARKQVTFTTSDGRRGRRDRCYEQ